MDASLQNSVTTNLESTHYALELVENQMERARELFRRAEEASKAVNHLAVGLNQREHSEEADSMQILTETLDLVVKKRSEELSNVTDSYLSMREHVMRLTCQIVLKTGS